MSTTYESDGPDTDRHEPEDVFQPPPPGSPSSKPRPAIAKRHQRRYLRSVIRNASAGDPETARTLLAPFLGEREHLLRWGIASRSGVIPRYDFYFLTDRRVGDLEITPFTGSFNVEVAYLHRIDSIHIRQPAILLMRVVIGLFYALTVATCGFAIYSGIDRDDDLLTGVGLIALVVGLVIMRFIVSPLLTRIVLRFLKSGMAVRVHGSGIGAYIFADRRRMNEMLDLSSQIAEMKRSLDARVP